MKLGTLFLIMFTIQAAIYVTSQGTYNENTPFWQAAQDPTNWQSIVIFALISSIGGAIVFGGIVVGGLLLGKADLAIFAAPVGLMVTWMVPIISFWRMITSETGGLGINPLSTFIASLVCGPLIILGLYSILTWWRSTFEG